MQSYNLIAVLNENGEKILFCKRRKDPYQGLFNLIGGKIEPGEAGLDAAYRELWEETSITKDDISLTHLMDFVYRLDDCMVEVYIGKLNKPVSVQGEENELFWSGMNHDFFDQTRYAGEGNMGHIMEHLRMARKKLGI